MMGKTASLRRTIRLATGYVLQAHPAGSGHTLLSPKGPIQLNESAATILGLCDGTHTREEIVARIVRERGGGVADDARAFLDAAQRRGWILES
jgi:pyrroloquinoline quinone biosynthesis protein D